MKRKNGAMIFVFLTIILSSFVLAQSTNPWVADSTGAERNSFKTSETIYLRSYTVCFPPAGAEVDVYIIDDGNLTAGDQLFDIRGDLQQVTTDSQGHIELTELWENPIQGEYDVVLDCNGNGVYDDEPIDSGVGIGFSVLAIGTVNASIGANSPDSHTSFFDPEDPNKENVLLQLELTTDNTENIDLGELVLKANGTGNDLDIRRIIIYSDINNNGRIDVGENEVGRGKYNRDNGEAEISIDYTLPVGESRNFLIAYVLREYEDGSNFSFSVVEITGKGTASEEIIDVSGLPIQSAMKTIGGAKSCLGSLELAIVPNTTETDKSVLAFVSGLTNCSNEVVSIRLSSCQEAENEVCSCSISRGTCNCNFIAPSVSGNYIIYGCVDKNKDDDFNDMGESGEFVLKVEAGEIEENETIPQPPVENNETTEETEETGLDIQNQIILILSGGLIFVLILLLIILIMLVKVVSKMKK